MDDPAEVVPEGCPTPDEIAAGRLQIQAGWDAREFYVRAGVPVPRWLARATDFQRGRAAGDSPTVAREGSE